MGYGHSGRGAEGPGPRQTARKSYGKKQVLEASKSRKRTWIWMGIQWHDGGVVAGKKQKKKKKKKGKKG
jgi:hypothetical protein